MFCYAVSRQDSMNAFANNQIQKSDSTEQSNFELPSDEEILQEVRDFYNCPVKNYSCELNECNEKPLVLSLGNYTGALEKETVTLRNEIKAKEKTIKMPTQAEYEESQRFLHKQMDKLMLEVARENYDLLPLAIKEKKGESLTQEEVDLIGERDLMMFVSIMRNYSIKGTREGEHSLTYQKAEKMALAMSSDSNITKEGLEGVWFFGFVAERLSPTQRDEIVEAIAKARVYEEANGFQVANVFFKRNTETGDYDFTFVDTKTNFQTESLILRHSHLAFESVLEMLESKEKVESPSTDSIMQTLLKESKEGKNNQGK